MTREEAIKLLMCEKICVEDVDGNIGGERVRQAYDMAIEALQADTVHKPDYSYEADMVRRLKEALSAEADDRLYIKVYADDEPSVKAEKLYQICGETENRETAKWLKEYFPSAEAVQGEWIMHGEPPWYVRECSKCGTKWHQWSGDSNPNYCGHCGAKMNKGGEDE